MSTGNLKNQAEFKKDTVSENQFEDRYGRKCIVYKAITLGEEGLINKVTVHLHEGDDKYTITEYLTKDQTTDYVLSGKEDQPRKYKRYLDAEVYVADLIGEKKRKEKEKKDGDLK